MKFIEVQSIPAANGFGRTGKAKADVEAFLETRLIAAEVDFSEEYKTPESCYSNLSSVIRRHNLPAKLHLRSGHIYIARTEKE